MSKYIDLTLALNKLWRLCEEDIDAELQEVFDFGRAKDALQSLPTIEVSEDCISRGWLEQEIEDILVESKFEDECLEIRGWNSALDTVVAIIEKAPSVVPSRAEGEWIDDPKNDEIKYCSNCELGYTKDFLLGMLPYDNPIPQMVEPPYCPNCGAKMKGVE